MDILAAVDESSSSRGVLETAGTLARLLAADVEAVHVDDPPSASEFIETIAVPLRVLIGDPAIAILGALGDDDVAMAVIGTGRARTGTPRLGHVAQAVMTGASKPVVVVPSELVLPKPGMRDKVVVPLDGAMPTTEALNTVLEKLAADIVAIHVFDPPNEPHYWDHYYYDFPAWHEEFRQRNCPAPGSRLEVGVGSVVAGVLNLAASEQATLIAVEWSQHLSVGRAAVVTGILSSARVPVLLVPVVPALAPPGAFPPIPVSRPLGAARGRASRRNNGGLLVPSLT